MKQTTPPTRRAAWLLPSLLAGILLAGPALAADSGPRTAGQVLDDAAITARIKTRLIGTDETKARQINVETSSGVVQLNGFVDSDAARTEAERIARETDGVTGVHNNLEVRTADRSTGEVLDDAGLAARVDAALLADSRTSGLRLDVAVRQGEVQLSGFARSIAEKSAAESVARSVKGVRSVRNAIDVR
jgi:hyperosmotically inducible protein